MYVRAFCKVLALALTPERTEIWSLSPQGNPLLDAIGGEVQLPIEGADLFFLDYHPEANWAHSCAYVALTDYGLLYHAGEWPPHQSIAAVKLTGL